MTNHNTVTQSATPEMAAQQIQRGDSIWVSGKSAYVKEFIGHLMNRAQELKGTTIVADSAEALGSFRSSEHGSYIRVIAGIGSAAEYVINNVDIQDIFYASAARTVEIICEEFGINTLVAELSPPDSLEMCKTSRIGAFITSTISNLPSVTKKIAIVNYNKERTPECCSANKITLQRFNFVCEEPEWL